MMLSGHLLDTCWLSSVWGIFTGSGGYMFSFNKFSVAKIIQKLSQVRAKSVATSGFATPV